MSFAGSFKTLAVSLRNVFRPTTTEEFPWRRVRPRAERYRTSFALVHDEHGDEACIGCQMCERICPSRIITVVPDKKRRSPNTGKMRGWHKEFTIDTAACIVCELCVQVCPTDSIVMLNAPQEPAYDRADLVLDRDRLYANEKLALEGRFRLSWGTGSRLREMQEPPKKERRKRAAGGGAGGGGAKAAEAPKTAATPQDEAAEAPRTAATPQDEAAEAPKTAATPQDEAAVEPPASEAPTRPLEAPAPRAFEDEEPTVVVRAVRPDEAPDPPRRGGGEEEGR